MNLLAKKAFAILIADFLKLLASIVAVSIIDFSFEELTLAKHFFFQLLASFKVMDAF